MIKQIRIDRQAMLKNEPCMVVRREDGLEKCFRMVEILGPSTLKHDIKCPNLLGAHVWIETSSDILGLPEGEIL